MIEQYESDYCRKRENEERAAANRAPNLAIHDVHFMMAQLYPDRAWSLSEGHNSPPPAA